MLCPNEQKAKTTKLTSESTGGTERSICVSVNKHEACALESHKEKQKVCEAPLHSVCQTVKCCLFSLSSLHHLLPIQRHTSLWGDSFLPSPAACKNWPRGLKAEDEEEEGGEERGKNSFWHTKPPSSSDKTFLWSLSTAAGLTSVTPIMKSVT